MTLILFLLMAAVAAAMFVGSLSRATPTAPRLLSDACVGVTVAGEIGYMLLLFARPQTSPVLQWGLLSLVVFVPVISSVVAFAYLRTRDPQPPIA